MGSAIRALRSARPRNLSGCIRVSQQPPNLKTIAISHADVNRTAEKVMGHCRNVGSPTRAPKPNSSNQRPAVSPAASAKLARRGASAMNPAVEHSPELKRSGLRNVVPTRTFIEGRADASGSSCFQLLTFNPGAVPSIACILRRAASSRSQLQALRYETGKP